MNYFELFDLPFRASIDHTRVQKKYIELQKKFHPDYFTQEDEDGQEHALEQSAHINKAYNIFRNSDKTLEYFLQQNGIITADEKYALPDDFLMEMMDINESVSEAGKEAAGNTIAQFENRLEQDVKDIFNKPAEASYSEAELEQLKAYFYKKKYLHRILDRLAD
ncbi:MAG: Fe-S protein assembly co-chaperone HscB [Ferruginibacter sp.]